MIFGVRCPGCHVVVRGDCVACWSQVASAPASSQSAIEFGGLGRELVHGLKYRNGRSLARPFAVRIVESLPTSLGRCDIDCVTWAPTSARRARRRGYDQAELIARDVAQLLGVPCRRLLRRVGRAVPQTGRSRRDRVVGPTFVARVPRGAHGVLVIDDVITTGATLDAARLALVRAGARHVICRAAAATPERATTSFR